MSLANKHRPDDFDKIIGQEHITHILKAQMKSDQRVNHNYLLFGPRGTGKTTAARILAKAINCLDLQDGNPCNHCANCTVINNGQTLDYVEIDAASHTGVDNIREEIISKVAYTPTQLKKKVYVIDEVHMLSKGAFNALLKTIEEPRSHMCFILATTEVYKVPETIISRCQVFNFKKVLEKDMVPHLTNICNAESLSFEPEALSLISRISEGCVRDAVKYIDQVSVFGDISLDNVTKFLGVAGESAIKDFLDIIKSGDRNQIFQKVDEIHNQGVDLLQFAKQNIMYIDQNLFLDIDFFLSISEAFAEIISTAKNYPYPAIVYKIVLNKFLGHGSAPITNNIPTQQTVVQDTVQTNFVDTKTTDSITIHKSTPIDSQEMGQADIEGLEDTQEKKIMLQLISKIDNEMLLNSLKDHTHIQSIQGNKIEFIVINKIAEILLTKEENIKMIEEKLYEITGEKLSFTVTFQSKEDFFGSL